MLKLLGYVKPLSTSFDQVNPNDMDNARHENKDDDNVANDWCSIH